MQAATEHVVGHPCRMDLQQLQQHGCPSPRSSRQAVQHSGACVLHLCCLASPVGQQRTDGPSIRVDTLVRLAGRSVSVFNVPMAACAASSRATRSTVACSRVPIAPVSSATRGLARVKLL